MNLCVTSSLRDLKVYNRGIFALMLQLISGGDIKCAHQTRGKGRNTKNNMQAPGHRLLKAVPRSLKISEDVDVQTYLLLEWDHWMTVTFRHKHYIYIIILLFISFVNVVQHSSCLYKVFIFALLQWTGLMSSIQQFLDLFPAHEQIIR